MKYVINGSEFAPASPVTNGEGFYRMLDEVVGAPAGVISNLLIDGQAVEPPDSDEPFPPPGLAAEVIEVTIDSPVDVLRKSLADGVDMLVMIHRLCMATAEDFRTTGREKPAQEAMGFILEKTGLMLEYVKEILRFVEVTFDGFGGAPRVSELVTRLLEVMKQLMVAQTKNDAVQIADLLEFELVPLLGEWREFLTGPDFDTGSM